VGKIIPNSFGSTAEYVVRGRLYLGALKREPIEPNRRQLGMEVAARSDDALRSHVAQGRTIGIGVGKGRNGTVRHVKEPLDLFFNPRRIGPESRPALRPFRAASQKLRLT
jgi:hypothetical protein